MKKIVILISALVVLLLVLLGCSSGTPTSPSPTPSPQNKSNTGVQSISITGFSFSPKEITINKGDTVTWTNEDTAVHNIVGGIIHSKDLAKGQSFSYTFTETGTYDYICTYHPSMKGNVMVK